MNSASATTGRQHDTREGPAGTTMTPSAVVYDMSRTVKFVLVLVALALVYKLILQD